MERRKKGPKNPRPRCPFCEKIVYATRIDKERKKKPKKPKRGRPKNIDRKTTTHYNKIGYWCFECEIFFYLDGTPNYKLRLKTKRKHKHEE